MPPRKPKLTPQQIALQKFTEREEKAQVRAETRKLGRTQTEQIEDQAAARQRRRSQATGYARDTVTGIGAPGGNRYQGIILAEFLVAVLVVAFAPLATGPKDDKGGPSPYRVHDLAQLAALGLVYFLLALASGTGKGRFAAWFGFLILLGVLFRKAAGGELKAEVAPLTGKQPQQDFGGGDFGGQGSGPPTGNFS